MEDKEVRYVVFTIAFIILFIITLSVVFIVKKYTKNNKKDDENNLQLSEVSCYKDEYIEDEKYNSHTEFKLIYNGSELYQYQTLIRYTTEYEYKDKIRTTLETMYESEKKLYSNGVSGSYKSISGGGETTLLYDLSNSAVRSYINTKYFKNNIYDSKDKLYNYFEGKNYKCEHDIKIG